MSLEQRHHVHVQGAGPATIFLAHGFGCDQNMWRRLSPAYPSRYRTVLFDLMGSGNSDASAYDQKKYGDLQGHADDVLEIVKAFGEGPTIFVGHSVSAMIGMLADLKQGCGFAAHCMVAPSPSYINDGDYHGGFSPADIEGLLDTLDNNYLGWASAMAPSIMGTPEAPALGEELTASFCRTDPVFAKQFARATFLSDLRAEVPKLTTPTLIMQCSDDIIAPTTVGEFMHRVLRHSTLNKIENVGHCPHLSAADACREAIDAFLAKEGL